MDQLQLQTLNELMQSDSEITGEVFFFFSEVVLGLLKKPENVSLTSSPNSSSSQAGWTVVQRIEVPADNLDFLSL